MIQSAAQRRSARCIQLLQLDPSVRMWAGPVQDETAKHGPNALSGQRFAYLTAQAAARLGMQSSGLASSLVERRQEVSQGLVALTRIGRLCPKGRQRTIDGLVDDMPVDSAWHALLRLVTQYLPDSFYLPEMWLVSAQVLARLGRKPAAQRAAPDGQDWVKNVHTSQVPAEFRDSFLHRDPINSGLLALATPARQS